MVEHKVKVQFCKNLEKSISLKLLLTQSILCKTFIWYAKNT